MSYSIETRGWNLAAIAECKDCGWLFETVLHRPAIGHAAKHAKKYGHEVNVQCVSNVKCSPTGEVDNEIE